MNQKKMQVLCIEQTGHILAAFTRAAAAESLVDVKGLVGTDLLVRNLEIQLPVASKAGGETLSVPMELLKAEIVDLNENAFVMPFNFMVGGGQANDLRNAPVPTIPLKSFSSITVGLEAEATPVTEDTKVWAQVQEKIDPSTGGEPIRRIVAGTIKAFSTGINDGLSVPLTLRTRPDEDPAPVPPGTYFFLVLVAGRKPGFFTQSLP